MLDTVATGTPDEITDLVRAWSNGDSAALERLIPLIDAELHRIARRYLERRRPGISLQTTSLLNEAYVRLLGAKRVNCGDPVHFFALCASIIRGIIVDHVRAHTAAKRGSGVSALKLTDAAAALRERGTDLVAIDEALTALAQMDPRRGRVVELRFFGGLTVKETAEAMRISPETVKRDWRVAKLWLMKELGVQAKMGGGQPLPPPR